MHKLMCSIVFSKAAEILEKSDFHYASVTFAKAAQN